MKNAIVIFGYGRLARTIEEYIRDLLSGQNVFFTDDFGKDFSGNFIPLAAALGKKHEYDWLLGIGSNDLKRRKELFEKFETNRFNSTAIVSGKSHVSSSAVIGTGTIVAPGCVIDTNVVIGSHSLLRPAVTLSHDVKIGNNVFIAPGATICGGATIGNHVFIGAGAIVTNGGAIPDGQFVKAGSVHARRSTWR